VISAAGDRRGGPPGPLDRAGWQKRRAAGRPRGPTMRRCRTAALGLCLASVHSLIAILPAARLAAAGDWPPFRGPGGTAVSEERALPTRWGPEHNVRWKADLPGRGLSGPVVARGRVYVTACTGALQDRLHVLAFDAATGKRLWQRQL